MKNTIISIVIFLIIIGIWFAFSELSLFKVCQEFEDKLDKISELVLNDNYADAEVLMDEVNKKWAETEKIWVFFVHQEDVDKIKTSISKLITIIPLENKLFAFNEIEELLYTLRIIRGNESFQIDNVF